MQPIPLSFTLLSAASTCLGFACLGLALRVVRLERKVNWLIRQHPDRPPSRYPLPSTDVSHPFTNPLGSD